MADSRVYASRIALEQLMALRLPAQGIQLASLKKSAFIQAGRQHALTRGRGIDFEEVRAYQAGDEIRHVDWRVTARTGKPHTKLFCEERERPVFFIVDLAQSMHFGTRVTFKSVIAQQAAALLAWAAMRHGDAVGGIIAREGRQHEIKPQPGIAGVLYFLRRLEARGHTGHPPENQGLLQALKRAPHFIKPGSLVFIFSDFYGFDDTARNYLTQLCRYNDIFLGFIYDALETRAPRPARYNISDGENFFQFDSGDKQFRARYTEHFQEKHTALQQYALQRRLTLLSLSTETDVVQYFRKLFGQGARAC